MASEPPPTAVDVVNEVTDALERLAHRGLNARRAVAALLGIAAKIAKADKGEGCEDEFAEAARFYYRKIQ